MTTDTPKSRSTAGKTGEKPGAKTEKTHSPTAGAENGENVGNTDPSHPENIGRSGLDTQGRFQIGERISIGVRGQDVVLLQAHSGREVVVSEAALSGLLDDTYFTEKVD